MYTEDRKESLSLDGPDGVVFLVLEGTAAYNASDRVPLVSITVREVRNDNTLDALVPAACCGGEYLKMMTRAGAVIDVRPVAGALPITTNKFLSAVAMEQKKSTWDPVAGNFHVHFDASGKNYSNFIHITGLRDTQYCDGTGVSIPGNEVHGFVLRADVEREIREMRFKVDPITKEVQMTFNPRKNAKSAANKLIIWIEPRMTRELVNSIMFDILRKCDVPVGDLRQGMQPFPRGYATTGKEIREANNSFFYAHFQPENFPVLRGRRSPVPRGRRPRIHGV